MLEYLLVKGYKENDVLRKSFNELAKQTFGISFEQWYQSGYWTDKYIPYSFIDGDRIIANVSVNKVDLIVNGEVKRAVQIGTVMTHPDYRNQGLSRDLIHRVLEEYEPQYDLIYLFANHTVLNFYPKFGFQSVDEQQYSLIYSKDDSETRSLLKLNVSNKAHVQFLYQFASQRMPVSSLFEAVNTAELFMFYCIYAFGEDIYYLEQEDVVVLFKQTENQIHIFDIVSRKEIDLERLLKQIVPNGTFEIIFHFTPPTNSLPLKRERFSGTEVLFVKGKADFVLPIYFKHSMTSQA